MHLTMKKNIFKIFMLLGIAGAMMASCSKEYLETTPQSSVSPSVVFEDVANAKLAVNGISRMMTTQYLSTQGMNGEGTIKSWYANFTGNDFQKCNQTGWAPLWNSTYQERATSSYDYYPWFYYYKLIGNANQIIANIDGAQGTSAEKGFIKAQGLVFRAYSFFMLSQLYCHRWVDSNNGADPGIVLRTDPDPDEDGKFDMPLSTLAETYAQIYADCEEAIKLFTESGLTRDDFYAEYDKSRFHLPDLNVAYAVYARAALTRNDWATAAKMAPLARKGHKLMSSEEYHSGFNTPNSEWIWGVFEEGEQTIYYYSFYAYQGSNASSSNCRQYPCAISKELYNQIPATDTRRKLWLEPTAEEYADKNLSKTTGRSTGLLQTRAKKEFANKIYSTSYIFMYMQFKHMASFMPGGGSFNIFRSAEMYLIEAEALCMLGGHDAEVQALLNELNKNHDAAYNCTKTGSDLLEEVKLYRRIDLWGEGFDWFDYKRWKQPIIRKSIKDGGSFHASFAITLKPEDANNWTWIVPKKETDYNDDIK